MRDKEKDAAEMALRRQKMLEISYRLFTERNIDAVSMPEIANACGYGRATLYRYFNTKLSLVIAVSTWTWEQLFQKSKQFIPEDRLEELTAAECFENYLDFFIDLYRNHRDLLRFNQYFNIYVQGEGASAEQMTPYIEMIREARNRFHIIYRKAMKDYSVRTDESEEEIFTATLHLMLAAVARYAVGLVYTPESGMNAEKELLLLKKLLLNEYTRKGSCRQS